MTPDAARKLKETSEADFLSMLSQDGPPVLAVFFARWSKPARTMLPVLEDILPEYQGVLRFALLNADGAPALLTRYGVLSLPTYLMFRRGKMTDRFIGLQSKERLMELIEEGLQKV